MAGNQTVPSDFSVRVAKVNEEVRYSVMTFNGTDKVDTVKWTSESHVAMEREDNRGVVLSSQTVQEYGEGSEYGKAARDEARRKKYGRQPKTYQLDNQPWKLSFNEPEGKTRKMRGIREGGANKHADYWVFLKPSQSSEFQAFKVDEWHKFLPAITHKILDIDQAEEKFLQRNKVMNQFALKAEIQNQLNDGEEKDGEELETKKSLKIKDELSSEGSDDEMEEREIAENNEKNNKKKKKNVKEKKDKRQRVENADEIAKYESSDGEDEGREYDYISDSGSDSEREQVPSDEKVEKQMVGVEEEEGARKMFESDDSDSDEDLTEKLLNTDPEKKKANLDIEERDSSGSDSDDPDSEVTSVVFLPKKDETGVKDADKAPNSSNGDRKREATDNSVLVGEELRPKDAKKAKSAEKVKFEEGLNEETVRRYLRSKPHTTKELLHKIKEKSGDLNNREKRIEMVTRLAAILKAIEPHQFKQRKGKKEVLFFSLTNTVA